MNLVWASKTRYFNSLESKVLSLKFEKAHLYFHPTLTEHPVPELYSWHVASGLNPLYAVQLKVVQSW